jgi:hypothetical protein
LHRKSLKMSTRKINCDLFRQLGADSPFS